MTAEVVEVLLSDVVVEPVVVVSPPVLRLVVVIVPVVSLATVPVELGAAVVLELVSVAVVAVELDPVLSARTTKESRSGSHLGHAGQAKAAGDTDKASSASGPTDGASLIVVLPGLLSCVGPGEKKGSRVSG